MKSILLWAVLVAMEWEAAYGQCYPITQMYNRNIQATQHTYGYDGQTGNARYKDGSYVLPEHVEDGIQMAVTAWMSAANGPNLGRAITRTETDYQSAQLKIRFENLDIHNDGCGTGTNTDIKLNQNWRFDGVSALWSTIVHEMGHAFLGSGHHGNSGIMSHGRNGEDGTRERPAES